MLAVLLAFAFSIYEDPFTDELSYRASAGNIEDGPGLLLECSKSWRPQWTVMILPDQTVDAQIGSYANLLARFDQDETIVFVARYGYRHAILEDKDAEMFVRQALDGDRLMLGLRGVGGQRIDMAVPLDGAREAIRKVEQHCTA